MNAAHMTKLWEGDFEQKLAHTKPRQAHLAGSGPVGKHCQDCQHWSEPSERKRPRKARCSRYQELTKRKGPAVPGLAMSCRGTVKAIWLESSIGCR